MDAQKFSPILRSPMQIEQVTNQSDKVNVVASVENLFVAVVFLRFASIEMRGGLVWSGFNYNINTFKKDKSVRITPHLK